MSSRWLFFPSSETAAWDNADRLGIIRIDSLNASILTGQSQSPWVVISDPDGDWSTTTTNSNPKATRYNTGLYIGYYDSTADTPPPYIAVWNITESRWIVHTDGIEAGFWITTSTTIGQYRYNAINESPSPLGDKLIVIGYTAKQDPSTWADYDGPT